MARHRIRLEGDGKAAKHATGRSFDNRAYLTVKLNQHAMDPVVVEVQLVVRGNMLWLEVTKADMAVGFENYVTRERST